MKYVFLTAALVLTLVSAFVYRSFPDATADVPVLYWVTSPNPAREQQAEGFHRWLIAQGLVNDKGRPIIELRLDSANSEATKQIIQGVSGVGGDIIDMGPLRYYQSVGLLTDVTVWGNELGFDPSHTWPAIEPAIAIDGRQYAFPCNVSVQMLWINVDTFARYGIDPPPHRWTVEQFEHIGRQFVEAANPPGQPRTVFFVNDFPVRTIHRSLGVSRFNETLTRSTMDDPRFAEALALKRKWMYEDRLLPTLADQVSFDTQAGFGGPTLQLFNRGQYGMIIYGRYALVQLRQFGALNLAVSEPPHLQWPNTLILTRCAGLYVGGTDPKLARYFLAYLASEEYNMHIIADGDALPPNPAYTALEAYSRPPEHPNEWGAHDAFAEAARSIAVTQSSSPFVLDSVIDRICKDAEDACMSGRLTPQAAATQAHERTQAAIARTLREQPDLLATYEALLAEQETIEQLRVSGQPVPRRLVRNPYHVYLYRLNGWLEED